MTIRLPSDLESFIHGKVLSGQFPSVEDAVAGILRRVKASEQEEVVQTTPPAAKPVPAWQRLLENMRNVPDEVFDHMPSDSSEQLDHYLYGTPKRPTT
jgi:Arc/MetJ-type ribon-helix-helix transcriptional regulator